jgi:hypothetical protein
MPLRVPGAVLGELEPVVGEVPQQVVGGLARGGVVERFEGLRGGADGL